MDITEYPAMDPEVKAKWLTALRSGEYEQGKNSLNRSGNFCCLGVLAEINGVPKELAYTSSLEYVYEFEYGEDGPYRSTATVPDGYCGLCASVQAKLMNMNDGNGAEGELTFPEIADYIEKNL